jgi:hypothetical protein
MTFARAALAAFMVCLCVAVAPAAAQDGTSPASASGSGDSREGEITRRQAEKAQQPALERPGTLERLLARAGANSEKPTRVWLSLGPMVPGAGMRLGAEFVTALADRTSLTARGLYSFKRYSTLSTELVSPGHLSDRLDLALNVTSENAPEMAFYGLGNETPESNRSSIQLRETWLGLGARLRPTPWRPFSIAAEVRRAAYELGRGRGATAVPFTPAQLPGADVNPTYWRSTGEVAIDTRPSAGYSRRGTLVRAAYSVFDRGEAAGLDFARTEGELTQLIPILRGNWVVALHGRAAVTMPTEGSDVPFFLQPYVGGGSSLRAYPSFRFRDRHALLLSGEFRWTPNEALDMAIFYDAGKVTSSRSELDLHQLHTDVGVGARFHSLARSVFRIELAEGREGLRLVFDLSPAW